MKIAVMLLVLMGLSASMAAAQQQQPQPQPSRQQVITPLPPGAVSLESCAWKATRGTFDADIRVKNHTNLKLAKTRLFLTFIDGSGEKMQGLMDMVGSDVSAIPGIPWTGKWLHGTFPVSIKSMSCGIVGVKFQGYPNVIFSAVK